MSTFICNHLLQGMVWQRTVPIFFINIKTLTSMKKKNYESQLQILRVMWEKT